MPLCPSLPVSLCPAPALGQEFFTCLCWGTQLAGLCHLEPSPPRCCWSSCSPPALPAAWAPTQGARASSHCASPRFSWGAWEVGGCVQGEAPGLHWRALSTAPARKDNPCSAFLFYITALTSNFTMAESLYCTLKWLFICIEKKRKKNQTQELQGQATSTTQNILAIKARNSNLLLKNLSSTKQNLFC